jgi:hypothetical protein
MNQKIKSLYSINSSQEKVEFYFSDDEKDWKPEEIDKKASIDCKNKNEVRTETKYIKGNLFEFSINFDFLEKFKIKESVLVWRGNETQ